MTSLRRYDRRGIVFIGLCLFVCFIIIIIIIINNIIIIIKQSYWAPINEALRPLTMHKRKHSRRFMYTLADVITFARGRHRSSRSLVAS